jgi:2'-5' RNA ligase
LSGSPAFHRILYFLRPPPDIAEQIVESAIREWREYGLTGKLVPADRLHFTVGHVVDSEEYPTALVPNLLQAGEKMSASFSPFKLVLERLRSLGVDDNRPLVLGGPGLAGVNLAKRKLLSSLQKVGIGFARELKSAAHMTLQYENHLVVDRPIEAIGWRASELVLVDSLVGFTQHVELGRWRFTGPEQLSLGL